MHLILKTLNVLALTGTGAWYVQSGGWEPPVTALVLLGAFIALEQASMQKGASGRTPRDQTMRGMSLLEAFSAVGLVDIEARDRKDHKLPPERFFNLATRELFLSGTTLAGVLTQHADLLHTLLSQDRHVLLLLLDPAAPDLQRIGHLVSGDLVAELTSTLNVIRARGFHSHPNFRIRFLSRQPPFTAVLVDGAIVEGSTPESISQVRVQVGRANGDQHQGIVCQFKRVTDNGGYMLFREDIWFQWHHEGKELPELFRASPGT